ncbi:hypothetical protein BJB45_06580 [Halomonas huangheensis]|uniref:Uncharacterized protein n=1 Tax=Halomonas huangheensis TaxID=1178482 RepID=W1N2P1_9GAMM|nr:hypothetical protein BJB45_06580 [Halomonas huangheensis]
MFLDDDTAARTRPSRSRNREQSATQFKWMDITTGSEAIERQNINAGPNS